MKQFNKRLTRNDPREHVHTCVRGRTVSIILKVILFTLHVVWDNRANSLTYNTKSKKGCKHVAIIRKM